LPESVEAALCDDLNTPAVLAELARLAGEARKAGSLAEKQRLKGELLAAGEILGLLQLDPADWLGRGGNADEDARIQALIDERNTAKKARDFARADQLRDELAREGVLIEDTAQGVRWRRG
jgi:cysteinyl-tRNA synthetase